MNAVDLALVLAVDGSASVTYEEFGLIAGGMAAALREPTIIAGLIGGPARASLCSLLLWSGAGAQEVMAGWTLIVSRPMPAPSPTRWTTCRALCRPADRDRRGAARIADIAQPHPRYSGAAGGESNRFLWPITQECRRPI